MATNSLETHIRHIARLLHEKQIARLYKVPNDIKIVDGQIIHAEQTPADFVGFTITGRVIVLECKMRAASSLQLGPRGLKAHQLIAICEAHNAGGIGLLVWQNDEQTAVIDADQVLTYSKHKGRKSIAWKDIPGKFKRPSHKMGSDFFWPFIVKPTDDSPLP